MDLLIDLLISVSITAIAYLFVPMILCISKKQLTLSQIRKIVIINGFCVWLIFQIIRIENGMDGNSAAVFLWSFVAYKVMKKLCLVIDGEAAQEAPCETSPDVQEPKKIEPKFVIIALSILLAISIGCNISQFSQAASADNTGHTEYILPDDYYEAKEKAEFYDETIVFVIEGYGDYYFTYNQMMHVTANDESFTYWAYNKEQAISLGYTAYHH